MKHIDDIICKKFLENPTKNPRSGRNISKGKDVYNGLVKLCKERNFDVSSLNETINQINSSDTNILIPFPKNDPIIKNSSNTKFLIPLSKKENLLIKNKSPDDLLQLYLTEDNIMKTLDERTVIDDLNKKYDTSIDTNSFIEWFKYYNYVNVPRNVKYLYILEKEQFIDPSYMEKFGNGEISEKMIYILFDWIKQLLTITVNDSPHLLYCYACTLFYIIFSRNISKINKGNLQMYGLLALYYSSIIIEHQPLEMSVIEYFSDGVFNTERLRSGAIEVFNILSGQLIYPSPIFFVDQNNKDLVSLIEFASSIPEISIYKPSLIAHTSIYMITGKYTIYTVDEMLHICSIIQKVLNRSTKTSLTTFKTSAVDLINKINVVCKEDPQKINLESTYKYNEPWHLGEFEEFDTIGEGVYGKITKIKRKLCGMEYVSKVSEDYHIDNFFIETALLKLLANQPNIISMCGFDYGIDKIKIILPLMKGSVYDLIKKDQLDKSKYNKYFHQILLGVEQCHDHDLIHRDIKPANILYDQGTDTMRIIDFGISVCYQSFKNITDTDSANSPDYRSPECFLFENKKYSQEIDVWALGAVFFFMMRKHALIDIYMKHPIDFLNDIFKQLGSPSENEWPGITNKLKEFNISKKDHNPNLSKNLYPFSELILDCLTLNPENRPTVYELLIKHKL